MSELVQHRVKVIEPGQSAESGSTTCEIDRHIEFDTKTLESCCFRGWNPLVYDAFVVAAGVEYCDRTKARQRRVWGRDITLRVPVHDPDRWSAADMGRVLVALTGDRWHLDFIPRKKPAPPSPQAPLPMDSKAGAVMPFSDGLDSYAVSRLMEMKYGRLLRVRLGARPYRSGKGLPFAGVPFRVRNYRAVESSFRSRAFKFGLLAGVAAFLSGVKKTIIAESGQGIIGSSLVRIGPEHDHVGSHPYFLDHMADFLRKLLGVDVRYLYPRIWHTKAQTLSRYFELHGDSTAWEHTRSCWQDQRHASFGGAWLQCGVCSACLLRRMSLHAAGRQEKRGAYVLEDLAAGSFDESATSECRHIGDAMRRHCVYGATELDLLAKVHRSPWAKCSIDRQVQRLCQSPSLAASDEDDVRVKLERLLERHASEWQAFKGSLGKDSFFVQMLKRGNA